MSCYMLEKKKKIVQKKKQHCMLFVKMYIKYTNLASSKGRIAQFVSQASLMTPGEVTSAKTVPS